MSVTGFIEEFNIFVDFLNELPEHVIDNYSSQLFKLIPRPTKSSDCLYMLNTFGTCPFYKCKYHILHTFTCAIYHSFTPKNLKYIAEVTGYSVEGVRKILLKALDKVKRRQNETDNS